MTPTPADNFLTLRIGDELFAVPVACVREILEVPVVTRVPTASEHMRGVANVRGRVIAIVDLRRRFGLTAHLFTPESRIVVMELEEACGTVVVGALADSVHDVVQLARDDLAPPPRIANRWQSHYVEGVARAGEDFVLLLNLAAVFSRNPSARNGPTPERSTVSVESSPGSHP